MRIFIAAGYGARYLVRPYARALREDGHEVASLWHDQDDPPPDADREALLASAAVADLADLRSSDLVAVLTGWPSTAGAGTPSCWAGSWPARPSASSAR